MASRTNSLPAKPAHVYNRDAEWQALARFVADERAGPSLGIVFGRRRQGKTFLLEAMCGSVEGFIHIALQDVASRALADLGAALAEPLGAPSPLALDSWPQAIDAVLRLGNAGKPKLVVLDEFPYLAQAAPELPSVIQRSLGPGSRAAAGSRTRLILCGSAISLMSGLLHGTAPLRGRATLNLLVNPFDYRDAAEFWGLRQVPELAVLVGSILGGTPAYRDLSPEPAPDSLREFDGWVESAVLDPASPLRREGEFLLAEDPSITDRALYHSILTAIAEGKTRRSQIAQAIGKLDNQLSHPLNVLQDLNLVVRREDALRPRRPSYEIAEPILRFHHALIRAQKAVWQPTFLSRIVGPHFEQLAREWTEHFAGPETLGSEISMVGPAVVLDPARRQAHEIDVVATGLRGRQTKIAVLGEAKWGRPAGRQELERLERLRDLLNDREGFDARGARLMLFSRGFKKELSHANRAEVVLVDLDRLYEGH